MNALAKMTEQIEQEMGLRLGLDYMPIWWRRMAVDGPSVKMARYSDMLGVSTCDHDLRLAWGELSPTRVLRWRVGWCECGGEPILFLGPIEELDIPARPQ